MRSTFAALAGCAALVLAGLSQPAEAKVGDKAWSQCVWSQAPESAQAWLAMPVPTWQSSYSQANVLLGHRLIALCDAGSADPMRPNRMPNWKSIASALRRAKPKAVPATSGSAAEVLLCQSSMEKDGKAVTYLYEIVRRAGSQEVTSFRQYYDEVGGQPLKLPQDLRILPKDASLVKRSCQAIGAKGELAGPTDGSGGERGK